jgi:hypothetical protein
MGTKPSNTGMQLASRIETSFIFAFFCFRRYGDVEDYPTEGEDDKGSEEEEDEEEKSEMEDSLRSNWNLATYLPAAVAQYFYFVISEFMLGYKAKRESLCAERRIRVDRLAVGATSDDGEKIVDEGKLNDINNFPHVDPR